MKSELNFKEMTDYEVFEYIKVGTVQDASAAKAEIIERYMPLIHKQGWSLISLKKQNKLHGLDTTDYIGDIYDKVENAINSVKLERVKPEKRKTWKFWICLNGYLRSANRDIVHDYLKKCKNEMSYESFTANAEDDSIMENLASQSSAAKLTHKDAAEEFEDNANKRIFWNAVNECLDKRFTPVQAKIWNLRSDKTTITKVCEETGLNAKEYKTQLADMRQTLKGEISKFSTMEHMEVPYKL